MKKEPQVTTPLENLQAKALLFGALELCSREGIVPEKSRVQARQWLQTLSAETASCLVCPAGPVAHGLDVVGPGSETLLQCWHWVFTCLMPELEVAPMQAEAQRHVPSRHWATQQAQLSLTNS